jgi:hypothetical protein
MSIGHDFELRSLKEEELDAWFDHLAVVFARSAPREYFVAHW